ncbi:ribonuclease H-like domain-containing protein [Tanacetum coccineum]
MEFESAQSNTTAKLPILKLGEYEMWVIRIKQYFQVQDYALWEVIENGNSWVSVPQTAQENGTSVTKMSVPVTAEEKTNKKNDAKARILLLMALPNEHQLTFSKYSDAKTMLQKIVSKLAILVWMNKAEIETLSIDDLYTLQIVDKGTNDVNTVIPAYEVSTTNPNVNTASPQVGTASFSDNVVYAFMVEIPNETLFFLQLTLQQIHEEDLEAIDLKWQLSLLSMRAKRYYQRICKKIFINTNDTAGYDKSKVECFNYHKMRHFARECRAPRSKEGQFRNQDNTRKKGNNEDASSKEMLAIDSVGFDCSDMAKEQCDDLIVKLNQTKFTATTYKRGLATLEEQLITYKKNENLFSEEVAVLKREVACKDYEINVLKSEFEKVKQEKEGIEFKIEKFDKASKDLDKLLEKQVSKDTSSFVESSLNVDKETIFPVDKKVESVKPKNHEKTVKKSVRYAEMYRSQTPRGNQRNWNGQKSNQLGSNFVMYNKACFICGSFNHVHAQCKYHQRERMVDGTYYNRVNYDYTVKRTHPNAQRNMVPRAVLLKSGLTPLSTARPGKPQQDDTRFFDSGCSRYMIGNIAYLSDFKEFDGGYVTFGGGAYGGRISGKGTLKTDSLDFEDLPDESQILLKIPRKDNMYSFDMKNIISKESLTCLVVKATSDESMLWHRRLSH